jgi:hypothetical protein
MIVDADIAPMALVGRTGYIPHASMLDCEASDVSREFVF